MSSTFGKNLKISIFGQSHSPAIGVVVDGFPAGFEVDMEELESFLERRAPGRSKISTQRKEADKPEFLSGLVNNTTCGAPLSAIIRNEDVRSKDYDEMASVPRPGHGDLTAQIKYEGAQDYRGGGHFSGRLTAPLCIAGGIALQMLAEEDIHISARILEIGGEQAFSREDVEKIISRAREEGDSVGGICECRITGLPAGLGDPMFDGMENLIAKAVFGIPGIKGIEFGAGFQAAKMKGSENNDQYYVAPSSDLEEDGFDPRRIKTKTNNAGGILGGITNGEDLVFRVAVKPTPSIAKPQQSVNMNTGEERVLEIKGRHDPCIAPRVLPCLEAASALVILDLML
ncbi:MAG: chorismate synthase [Firmicutes bacterium]|nr:chorismate synthase [Bacillota bacterium]